MKCTVTGDALHRLRLRGQAGPRQHPQRRPGRRLPALPRRPGAGRGLQHRRRPRQRLLDAGGDRALRADRRPRAELGDGRGGADRRPPLVDQRPRRVRADYAGWRPQRDLETILREIYEANVERWARGAGVKLSVVIPAHNEEGTVGETVEGIVADPDPRADRLRGDRRRRLEQRRHRGGGRTDRGAASRRSAACPPRTATASASRCAPASTSSRATRWRS